MFSLKLSRTIMNFEIVKLLINLVKLVNAILFYRYVVTVYENFTSSMDTYVVFLSSVST
jgi:hypothetical protein